MFLILSSVYIDQELKSEFGSLPPALLPIGNRRLFQHQVLSAPKNEKVFLTLPESYQLLAFDQQWLEKHKVSIIKIPDNTKWGESLVIALHLIDIHDNAPLHILRGDTLALSLPEENDIVATATTTENYNWLISSKGYFTTSTDEAALLDEVEVVIGYFKFSHPKLLIQTLISSKYDFIKGLNKYHQKIHLSTIRIDSWLDFGHVNTYYQSKSNYTTQRAFNHLKIDSRVVTKSSSKNNKVEAEAFWFKNVPSLIRQYLPQYLGDTSSKYKREMNNSEGKNFSYSIEYLFNCTLNELFVFSALPDMVWKSIFEYCLSFIDSCRKYKMPIAHQNYSSLEDLLPNKTQQRLKIFCQSQGISINTPWQYNNELSLSFSDMLDNIQPFLPLSKQNLTVMHGDFCFSNILFDFRSNSIKTFDPRGITAKDEFSIYGDSLYDIAKLSHSIIGLYDMIIAGYFELEINEQNIQFNLPTLESKHEVQNIFIQLVEEHYGLSKENLYAMQIHLFLSMLSLHSDDESRQMALMANAFRLYQCLAK